MALFTTRPVGDAMVTTIWGSSTSWTLTALPMFIWMGEILFRTRLSEDMFRGLAPWMTRIPGRLLHRSEEHTSELQSLMRISYAVFCLKKKKNTIQTTLHLHRKVQQV